MRLLVQTPYQMQTLMALRRQLLGLALQIIRASNYKGSPLLTASTKALARWNLTGITIIWVLDMDEADTCEVAVGVDTGVECPAHISLSRSPVILVLRVRLLRRVQCDKVSPIRVFSGNADFMLMGKRRLAVIRRRRRRGKLRLQSVTKRTNAVLTHIQRKL
jgi:hypothetical protein